MADLEVEHDYLLEREGLVGVANRLEGEELVGVSSRLEEGGWKEALVGVAPRPALCSLMPDPGPCGSQVIDLFLQ